MLAFICAHPHHSPCICASQKQRRAWEHAKNPRPVERSTSETLCKENPEGASDAMDVSVPVGSAVGTPLDDQQQPKPGCLVSARCLPFASLHLPLARTPESRRYDSLEWMQAGSRCGGTCEFAGALPGKIQQSPEGDELSGDSSATVTACAMHVQVGRRCCRIQQFEKPLLQATLPT